jgi:hypothetical protein
MIDKDAFLAGMAVLAGSFGREVDAGVQRAYYVVLSPKLTTDEFERAVSLTISSESFWPSPATILGKVQADDSTRALLAFEHVNRVLGSNGGYRYLTAETYQREFDAPTKAAISAVGGLGAITNTSEERWPSLQKKFVGAFIVSTQPKLTARTQDAKVRQLVRETASTLSGRDRAAGRDA